MICKAPQQKKPTKRDILNYPTAVIAYDLLSIDEQSLMEKSLAERRVLLEQLVRNKKILVPLTLSPAVSFDRFEDLEHVMEKLSAYNLAMSKA